MASFLNHVAIAAPRNGTATHTVTPSSGTTVAGTLFTPTAGRFLLCIVEGPVTSYGPSPGTPPTGWTTGSSIVVSTGLYAWYRASAAGSDSFTVTHNASNFPVLFHFFEFAPGTTFGQQNTSSSIGLDAPCPAITGLTGANFVMSVVAREADTGTLTSISGVWGETEILDTFEPFSTTGGYWASIAYTEDWGAPSFAPSCNLTIVGTGGGETSQGLTFSLKVGGVEGTADPIFFVNESHESYASRTTTNVNVPAGVVNGDLMIWRLLMGRGDNTATVTRPAGWSDVPGLSQPSSVDQTEFFYVKTYTWYRIASSEPASYAVTHITAATQPSIVAYRGVDLTTPFDVSPSYATSSVGSAGAPISVPGVTTITPKCMIDWWMHDWGDQNLNLVPPLSSGVAFTQTFDVRPLIYAARGVKTTAGATGTVTQAQTNSIDSGGSPRVGQVVALRPAATGVVAYVGITDSEHSTTVTRTGVVAGNTLVITACVWAFSGTVTGTMSGETVVPLGQSAYVDGDTQQRRMATFVVWSVATGGSKTFTCTDGGDETLHIAEFSGVDGAVDVVLASATGTSTTPAAPASGTHTDGSLVYNALTWDMSAPTMTPDTGDGFTQIANLNVSYAYQAFCAQYLVASGTSSVTANWTSSESIHWLTHTVLLTAASAPVPVPTPTLHYDFAGSGTTAIDATGHGNHGALTRSYSPYDLHSAGKLNLTNSQDACGYVPTTDPVTHSTLTMTIYASNTDAGGLWVLALGADTSGYSFYIQDGSLMFIGRAGASNLTINNTGPGTHIPSEGEWKIAVTHDGDTGNLDFYVNGVVVRAVTGFTGALRLDSAAGSGFLCGHNPYLHGAPTMMVDDLRWWDTVTLTPVQVAAIADGTAEFPPAEPAATKYTELEWSIGLQAPATGSDVYEFWVYDGSTPLTATVTPQLTATSGTPTLTVADGIHGHTAENVALGVGLVVAGASHTLLSDNVVTNYVVLAPANAAHVHTAANVGLEVSLAPADATHAHTADNTTITEVTSTTLVVQAATHDHTAENTALGVDLVVQGAVHAHTADAPVLNYVVLAPADAVHGHTAVAPVLYPVPNLVVVAAVHDHTAENVSLGVDLVVAGASHTQVSDNVVVTEVVSTVTLVVADAGHIQTAEEVVLDIPSGPPVITPIGAPFEWETTTGTAPMAVLINTSGGNTKWLLTHQGSTTSQALVQNIDSAGAVTSLGTPFVFDSSGISESMPVPAFGVTADQVLCVYRGLDQDGYAQVLDYNTSTWAVTGNTATEFEIDTLLSPALIHLRDDIFVTAWRGTLTDGFVQSLTVSGGTVTANGTAFEFDIVETRSPQFAPIDANHVLLVHEGEGSDGYARVINIDPSTFVCTQVAFLEFDPTSGKHVTVNRLDATHYLITWTNATAITSYAQVFTVNASTYAITAVGSPLEGLQVAAIAAISERPTMCEVVSHSSGVYNVVRAYRAMYVTGVSLDTIAVDDLTWAVTLVESNAHLLAGGVAPCIRRITNQRFVVWWEDDATDNGFVQTFDFIGEPLVPDVDLVVADALHAHTADAPILNYVVLTPANATHAHTAQSFTLVVGLNVSNCVHTILPVAGPYHEPLLGYISTPDPGPLPDAFIIVAKISNMVSVEIAHQADTTGAGWFWTDPFPMTFASFLRFNGPWIDPLFVVGSNSSDGTSNETNQGANEQVKPRVPYWALAVTLTPTYEHWMYYSVDGTTWIPVNSNVPSGYPAMPVWQSDYPVVVGATSSWNSVTPPQGSFHSVEMRTGTDPAAGSIMWRMDVTEYVSGSAWTDGRGHTWTLSNPASIIPDTKLVENSNLVVQNVAHAHTSDNVAIVVDLVVQSAAHAHVADNVTTNYVVLAPADGVHAHTSVAPTLGVDPAVQSAAHAITSTDVVLVVDPAVQSATHLHSAENVTLQLQGDLSIQSAVHNHAADNVAPLNINMDGVQNAVHAHTADNIAIDVVLVVQGAVHVHTAANVIITPALFVADALHTDTAENVLLTTTTNLTVQDAAHAHSSDNLIITQFVAGEVIGAYTELEWNLRLQTPASGVYEFRVFADSEPLNQYITPQLTAITVSLTATVSPATLTLAGQTPGLPRKILVDSAVLALAGQNLIAKGTGVSLSTIDPATLTLSGVAVFPGSVTAAVVDTAILSLSGQNVIAKGSGTVVRTVDIATLTLAGQTPVAAGTGSVARTVDPATLTLSGQPVTYVPSGTSVAVVTPATLTLAGQSVGFVHIVKRVVTPATLVLSGQDPIAKGTGNSSTTVTTAILVLAGITPDIRHSPNSIVVQAVLTLTGVTPVATGTGVARVTVDPAVLTLTGGPVAFAGGNVIVSVGTAVLTLSGVQPIGIATGTATGLVTAANITIVGHTVTAIATGTARLIIDPATLTLSAQTPIAKGSGSSTNVVAPATISLTGTQPLAIGTGTAKATIAPALIILLGVTVATIHFPRGNVQAAILNLIGIDISGLGTGISLQPVDSAELRLEGVTPSPPIYIDIVQAIILGGIGPLSTFNTTLAGVSSSDNRETILSGVGPSENRSTTLSGISPPSGTRRSGLGGISAPPAKHKTVSRIQRK